MRAVLVQLRFDTGLTSEQYVIRQAWREATLARCPLHPRGGCAFARHGSYARVTPPGARIARWYCPQGHCSFSLLPDCLASRFSGTLVAFEQAVAAAEQAESLEAAADQLRADPIELPGALRWLRRRVRLVALIFTLLRGLLPEHFAGCEAQVSSWRARLSAECALVRLRGMASAMLAVLPPPLGFGPWPVASTVHKSLHQHSKGPDPPATAS